MGLQMNYTAENGAVGNYWKITGFTDTRGDKVSVSVSCFKDKAFSDALKTAPKKLGANKDDTFVRRTFQIAKPNVTDYIEGAYTNLKLDPYFSTAVDA